MARKKYEEVFALDQGASTSGMAGFHINQRKSKMIENEDGYEITPSYVWMKNPRILSEYGEAARKSEVVQEVVRSSKRDIGKYEQVTNEDGVSYHVRDAVNTFIYKFHDGMQEQAGQTIGKVLLTVPGSWEHDRRQIYSDMVAYNMMTGQKGFEIVGMLEESVAAGMSFTDSIEKMNIVNVCDIGAYTTDLAVMKMDMKNGEGKIEVKATDGDETGGDDWTGFIMDEAKKQLKQQGISYEDDLRLLRKLRDECENFKTTMLESTDSEYTFQIYSYVSNKNVRICFTKTDYYRMAELFWVKIKPSLDRFAQKTKEMGVDTVLLVGGSISNPYLREKLKVYYTTGLYKNVKVISHKEKTAVALGAANYAHWVFGEKKKIEITNCAVKEELPEVTEISLISPESFGVKALCSDHSYVISNIIKKGEKLPCVGEKTFGIADVSKQIIGLNLYSNRSEKDNTSVQESQYIGQLHVDISGMAVEKTTPLVVKLTMNPDGKLEVEGSVDHLSWEKQKFVVRSIQ